MSAPGVVSERPGKALGLGAAWLGSDRQALLVLGLAWTALWALTIPVGDIPLNDDWVYALAVRSILETGRFALPSPSSANVFVQAYWGALFCLPFGFSFTALRVSTFVLGAVGVLSLYLLLREAGARRRVAFVGALSLAVNPLYLELATTFMTDVPFTALVTASLWLYVRGAQRESAASLAGAVALAFAAILVRQFALILPFAFGVAHVVRKGARARTLAVAALPVVLGLALHVAFERWLVATGRTPRLPVPLGGVLPTQAFPFVRRVVHLTLLSLPYLGLFMAPFLACLRGLREAGSRAGWWRPWMPAGAITAVLVAALAASGERLPDLSNILIPSGLGPLTLHDTWAYRANLPVLPSAAVAAWVVVTGLSAWAAALVLLALGRALASLVRGARRAEDIRAEWPQALVLAMIGAYGAGILLVGHRSTFFDRYLLLFVPPLAVLLLLEAGRAPSAPSGARRVLPGLLLATYALFAVPATHDYLAWNRARWRATASLTQAGVSPHRIDGGYEFNGWLLNAPDFEPKPGKSEWWVDDDEYAIAAGPLRGYEEVGRFGFRRWLGLAEGNVFVLHRTGANPS